ncbi:MAG: head-tail adaptor protein [Synergistales bacterium]|nr:head-tail adaptor protein [Synergistales bacterium]
MKHFTASDLKDYIEILRTVEVSDGFGGFTTSEVSQGSVFANVFPVKSSENLITTSGASVVEYEITVRSQENLQKDDVVAWVGKRLVCQSLRLIQGQDYMLAQCQTEVK